MLLLLKLHATDYKRSLLACFLSVYSGAMFSGVLFFRCEAGSQMRHFKSSRTARTLRAFVLYNTGSDFIGIVVI